MEVERKQAEDMAAARAVRAVEFNKEYRYGLDIQRAEMEAQKLVELEKHEAEMALRRNLEQAQMDQEAKEAEDKRRKIVEMQQQMMADVEEAKRRKKLEEEAIR